MRLFTIPSMIVEAERRGEKAVILTRFIAKWDCIFVHQMDSSDLIEKLFKPAWSKRNITQDTVILNSLVATFKKVTTAKRWNWF